jgi:hypothetical protein
MIRRSLFCLLWFVVFWIGMMTIGAGLAGATAGGKTAEPNASFGQGFDQGYQAGVVAGIEFRQRYGTWIFAGAAALAVAGTLGQVLPGTKR